MDGEESILEALEDYGPLAGDLSDVDMIDAEPSDTDVEDGGRSEATKNAVVGDGREDEVVSAAGRRYSGVSIGCPNKEKKKKKKKRRNNKEKAGGSDYSFGGLNRFVCNTCRHLKEKKQYLVWSAVSCLGVPTVRGLVKEVDAIQACGGQQTADGARLRTSGGILWNILKTREPKAYKEIMAKGREFEKQFRPSNIQKVKKEKFEVEEVIKGEDKVNLQRGHGCTDENSQSSVIPRADIETHQVQSNTHRPSALDRIRRPVSYDDLFEEGEIHCVKEKEEVQVVMNEQDKVNPQSDYKFSNENGQRSVIQRDDIEMDQMQSNMQRSPALDRMLKPVSYDDLLEEGEIY